MRYHPALVYALAALAISPASAQLGLPPLGGVGSAAGDVLDTANRALDPLERSAADLTQSAARLADARLARIDRLMRQNRDLIELDAAGDPARRGELILMGANDADLAKAQAAGFVVLGRETLGTLDIAVTRLATPGAQPLAKAEATLRRLLPDATISADTLHFQAGGTLGGKPERQAPAAAINQPVGVIDGAPSASITVTALRGFTKGAPTPSQHGSAIVSLLKWAGVRRVAVADVYGTDPAGGSALAVVKGLDWLLGQRCRIVSISLVGPRNPLVGRAIAAAQQRGVHVIAAVGNDGPAAPPAYPASYPGVIAVTGVDGRNRALIEAGRAAHLDYAAPAADLLAANAAGRWVKVRGTSYAVPFVAARAAAALDRGTVIPMLDREAIDLGRKGPDTTFGRGLLCQSCARRK